MPYASIASSLSGIITKHCQSKRTSGNAGQFKKIMLDMAVGDRPDWWMDRIGSAAKKSMVAASTSSKSNSSAGGKSQPSVQCHSAEEVQP